ncbi:FliC/FljB family flagellin [Alcaligenes faecalis]|nr:FliC/FljB family flagellin [Alcaligenes faecalis]
MVSQNNLTKSQNSLGTAIERLSSGLRINSAKDDAAGQAIANRFTANINGLTQAARNANDGISIAQTTEGALNEINENLQRIRTLTVDASNGTKSASDLQSIQDEIGQRLQEIDRVSKQTQFNGVKVLGEKADTLTIQVGAHDGETIDINLREINASALGLQDLNMKEAYASTVKSAGAAVSVDISTVDGPTGLTGGGDVGPLMKNAAGDYFVQVTGGTEASEVGYYAVTLEADGTFTTDTTLATTQPSAGDLTEVRSIETKFGAMPTASGAAVDGDVALVKDDDGNFYAKVTGAKDPAGNGLYAATVDHATGAVTVADWNTKATVAGAPTGANASPLDAIDKALGDVDTLRGELGAVQNRFQSTIANLNNTVNNLSAARSRIEDADYAVEVSNMTRSQILQQAGTSVLAQANQVPQTVLSLLR